ncbi:UDP-N-acetylmuramoyl-tripeptide--D-alanyl-D-alanine ligase [Desulfuromusa kysingii]|uniref:UDP-N-acetylmuramoyl-tripeptide--D-alanyl-D-alanine ligase n=1 Tax=Desulfuromusa kysingii TaxID=37625 RepID=A0A1H3ZGK6_9BACT|nr:UDP-N-acetylmuramoyl-tripeptide--D-alanyl-D-alanine ligase [Desulfuromusa kysingii]SEA22919.1 UDP-N-acetylmuramoyl-tripeptide--D-alanyl-D-alanine ligase [Desulfuromusa kysingii]
MFDLERIARITDGDFSGRKVNCQLSGISTDSRNLIPGSLFVPLRGERFDGHDYLSQAVKNGVAACLTEEVVAGLSVPVVRVADTLRALGDIAAAYRLQLNGPLVAITGSVGKTTTKEMLATILLQVGPGLKTAGNFNNLIGLPLTLFRLEKEHQWAVLEMGTSAIGEIERLTEIARPTVGIITNIGPAHLATLQGLDGVSRAKGELFAGLQGGTAILNRDDYRVARLPVANGVKKLTYGLSIDAQVRAENIEEDRIGVRFELLIAGQKSAVQLALPGKHNVLNALAAAAAASELSVPMTEIVTGLAKFRAIPGRMNLSPLPCGGLLLDDSYNSNPLSAYAALDVLATLPGPGRRVAVLGDMLELGEKSAKMHIDLGAKAAEKTELLIAVGGFATQICQGAATAGMNPEQMVALADTAAAIEYLQKQQRSGDKVLVKGSRGVRLEQLAAALKATVAASVNGKKGN